MILTTEEVITIAWKVISATTKMILATEEVITATWMLSQPLKSDFSHWRSDHNHFESYLSR